MTKTIFRIVTNKWFQFALELALPILAAGLLLAMALS